MVRLESLPFDIVHIIISHIGAHDLPAVALVCSLFNSAATPKIYANIRYSHQLAKQWGQILCPVEFLSARSDLLAHLKSLGMFISLSPPTLPDNRHMHRSDLRAVPLYKGAPHPQFTRACIHVVQHAPGLASFSWATAGLYQGLLANILNILAPGNGTTTRNRAGTTREKASMLDEDHDESNTNTKLLRLSLTEDGLSSSDAHVLQRLGPVEHMVMHKPSLGATRALVEWASGADTLTSLTISNNYHLDAPLLGRILAHTRQLKSLSVTNCPIEPHALFSIITGFGLESLGFTLPRDVECATFPSLPTLRHLSVLIEPPNEPDPDRHTNAPTDPLAQRLFRHLFKATEHVKLYSLTLRLASHRTITPKLVNTLIITHGRTLRRLNLFKLAISARGVADIVRHVSDLEQLSLELGGVLDDLVRHCFSAPCRVKLGCDAQDLIIEALPAAQHPCALIDTSPTVTTHRRPTHVKSRALTRAQATQLLEAGPVLGNVVSQQRNWAKEYVWTAGRFQPSVSMRKVRTI
ncbi:unnamed protein product [Rhizoctonia solani]|uniref:F-box domain-containing protein n=1 Tax=Rhizoctonia solani TaxID=456999 RepID=A0A8H3I0B9_9AGAM|nr:unnamed protein product [Rhizoctonia solani]